MQTELIFLHPDIGSGIISSPGVTLADVNWHLLKYGELGVLNSQLVPKIERMTAFVEGIEDPDFETAKQLLENYLL
eukprot:3362778-Ditylum_brightwellii.AAC.1